MENIAIIYWSGTGNTESMANAIAEGISAAGGTAAVMSVEQCSPDQVNTYSKIAFGCPSMGDEVLEESEFEPMFEACKGALDGKKIALFGSYGWGDGEWMRNWEEDCKAAGAELACDSVMSNEGPGDAEVKSCEDLGAALA